MDHLFTIVNLNNFNFNIDLHESGEIDPDKIRK